MGRPLWCASTCPKEPNFSVLRGPVGAHDAVKAAKDGKPSESMERIEVLVHPVKDGLLTRELTSESHQHPKLRTATSSAAEPEVGELRTRTPGDGGVLYERVLVGKNA